MRTAVLKSLAFRSRSGRLLSTPSNKPIGQTTPVGFQNSPLPDGDVPDVSLGGLPFKNMVMPFISRVLSTPLSFKEEQQQLPLGRWKVSSCDEVLENNASATAVTYDHGVVTALDAPLSTGQKFDTKLPDGDVPDVSAAGLPLSGVVKPFVSNLIAKGAAEPKPLPLGRWQLRDSEEVEKAFKKPSAVYDHSF